MGAYLHKLMIAESGGRPTAKNPLSTALGPFQFINSTFLDLVDRHFADEVQGMNRTQVLGLRTNMDFSRRAVIVFNNENAAFLQARGIEPTFAHMRLSHLLGAPGAVQALRRSPDTHLTKVFSSGVLRANPFMKRLTVAGLVNRAEREVGTGTWKITSEVAGSESDMSKFVTKPLDAGSGKVLTAEASAPKAAPKEVTKRDRIHQSVSKSKKIRVATVKFRKGKSVTAKVRSNRATASAKTNRSAKRRVAGAKSGRTL
jgi:hypothetical protein